MIYTPNLYKGEHFSEIFTEILHANNTVNDGLVRVIDDIKYEQPVTSLAGELELKPYVAGKKAATDTGSESLAFSDVLIKPAKFEAYAEFEMDAIRSTRFSRSMASGAANIQSSEFETAIRSLATPKLGLSVENKFWSLVKPKLTGAVTLTGAAITASNVTTAFADIYASLDSAVLNSGEARIYAGHSVKQAIMQANVNAAYRDIFSVVNGQIFYLGIPVVFAKIDYMTAGRWSDYVLGTDLTSDFAFVQVDKVQANSDTIFMRAVLSLDAAVLIPEQKVVRLVA